LALANASADAKSNTGAANADSHDNVIATSNANSAVNVLGAWWDANNYR
jgi:hypothetical protein